jgi:hypothetical protein
MIFKLSFQSLIKILKKERNEYYFAWYFYIYENQSSISKVYCSHINFFGPLKYFC